MGHESVENLPLVESAMRQDPEEEVFGGSMFRRQNGRLTRRERWLCFIIVLQAIALAAGLYLSRRQDSRTSPADSVVEYEIKSFTPGREHKTVYQGLNDEADRAWGDLYNHTLMKIPRSEAILLPNKTYPIKDEPGYYLGGLDVFHQLHCLNNVRRALHRDRYADDTDLDDEHVSHCIDTIRQSLMCNADTSVNVWQWSNEVSAVVGYSTQAHSCKNFDKLREWARSRRVHKWINTRLFVEDDLPDPPILS
ncbi:hypothetical protein CVT26_007888 [Gymnopilus dilepis]|uniref:Tat pathway signal sequence n=1 Tax=Gymnopilus dilepis TaxID=231916 RepID=A0A409YKC4_9AGAR|nr:hypothetical protein CVT26_007888 [Gymnopilus dilepis]